MTVIEKIFSNGAIASVAFLVAFPASAIPFQVQGSSLDANFDEGGALGIYLDNAMASPIDLGQGESFEFDFGTVLVPFALGKGSVELSIDMKSPTPEGPVIDGGVFGIKSFFITVAAIDWGAPVLFDYTYQGQSGGLFEIDMYDLKGIFASTIHLKGKITNVASPVDVPEPGMLSLLGAGLVAMGFAGRRRRKLVR